MRGVQAGPPGAWLRDVLEVPEGAQAHFGATEDAYLNYRTLADRVDALISRLAVVAAGFGERDPMGIEVQAASELLVKLSNLKNAFASNVPMWTAEGGAEGEAADEAANEEAWFNTYNTEALRLEARYAEATGQKPPTPSTNWMYVAAAAAVGLGVYLGTMKAPGTYKLGGPKR